MKVRQINKTEDGYLKHSKLATIKLDSIPKIIFSSTYSSSDNASDRFLTVLETAYQNPLLKPLLNVIAVNIIAEDDIAIIYGATLPFSVNGRYTSNKNEIIDQISKQPLENQNAINMILSALTLAKTDPLQHLKKVDFQIHLSNEKLLEIISHEFGHCLADIIFNNYTLGFSTLEEKNIYEKCRDAFALKCAQLIDFYIGPNTYKVSGTQILNFEYNRICSSKSANGNCSNNEEKFQKEVANLEKFFNSVLSSTDIYRDSFSKESEIFARIFEISSYSKDIPIAGKILSEFSEFIEKVVNPKIDEFMHKHQIIADILCIEKNESGSYGIEFCFEELNINEQLYFAIANDDTATAQKLIMDGADPNYMMVDIVKIINLAFKRENYELLKFILENSKNIDFLSKDITNKTTFEIAREVSQDAYDWIKTFEPTQEIDIEATAIEPLYDLTLSEMNSSTVLHHELSISQD